MIRLIVMLSLSTFISFAIASCQSKGKNCDEKLGCVNEDILYTFNNERDYEHDFLGREEIYVVLDDDRLACITLRRLGLVLDRKFSFSDDSKGHLINKAIKREILFDYDELKDQSEFIFGIDQSVWEYNLKFGFPKFKEKYSYGNNPLQFYESDQDLIKYSVLYVFFTEGFIHINGGVHDNNILVEAKGYMGVK